MHAQAHCLAHQVCLSFILSLFVCGSRGREREREKLDEKLMMILFPAFPFIYYIFISVLREYFGANNCDIYTCPVCVHTNRRWWRKISEQTVKWFWSVYTSKWTTITKTKAKTDPAIDHLSVHCVLVCSMFDLQHFVGVCVLGKDWKWNGWTIPSFVRSFQPTIWMPLKNICHEKNALTQTHKRGRNAIFGWRVFGVLKWNYIKRKRLFFIQCCSMCFRSILPMRSMHSRSADWKG